jgi:Phage tail protein
MIKIFQNGIGVDQSLYGLRCLSFNVESLGQETQQENIPGRDGPLIIDGDLLPRNITAKFFTEAADRIDYKLLQHKLYRLFDPRKEITIIDEREPDKRWSIRTQGTYTPERLNHINSTFELSLLSAKPYAESVGTTLSPVGIAQANTNYGDPPVQYVFNTSSFSVWNDGDAEINPSNHELVIEFKGASTNLAIENITTGDNWTYTGSTTVSDTVKLEGIRPTKNGLSIFRNTNRKVITLEKGWNEFKITGATNFTISFDFRYLYV